MQYAHQMFLYMSKDPWSSELGDLRHCISCGMLHGLQLHVIEENINHMLTVPTSFFLWVYKSL